MRRVVPSSRDVREFREGSENHDDSCDGSAKSSGAPSHGGRRTTVDGVNSGGVEGSVEIVDADMNDPDSVEIDK